MALRDLIVGGGSCAVPGTSSAANPLGRLAESIFGSASKTQERLQEFPAIPASQEPVVSELDSLASLPGSEYAQQTGEPLDPQVSGYLQGFRTDDRQGYQDVWNEILDPWMPQQSHFQIPASSTMFSEFGQIYEHNQASSASPGEGTPQGMLSGYLRSFLDSSKCQAPFHPMHLPDLGLSVIDKQRIRDRSSIMARHIFADKGEQFASFQVNALLHSLDIESDGRCWESQGASAELEELWNGIHARGLEAVQSGQHLEHSNQWAAESSTQDLQHWVGEFRQQADGWADQFDEDQTQQSRAKLSNYQDLGAPATSDQTRSLADTLSQNQDSKFQNSELLQFVSKMSTGRPILENSQVKPKESDWADEFQHTDIDGNWATEIKAGEHTLLVDNWANEYSLLRTSEKDGWISEFSKLSVKDFSSELRSQSTSKADLTNEWVDSYERYVEQQVSWKQNLPSTSKRVYVFADQNPYVGHLNPLKEGQELFQHGLLSEAVLALEAEVLKNPDNAKGWCLLGIAHAENDDDKQAIASLIQARDTEPTNLEVLLSLGVSHTNELEHQEALQYLRGWLEHHANYGAILPKEQVPMVNHTQVTRLFDEAAQTSPNDADVHTVLGVLYNLSKEYDKAIAAFQKALELKPKDYSLWNKLGATQANSARSADALHSYQEALNLKPNYVRAWSNMGISYGNQGQYEESLPYYVRALCMNPKAESVWQYLRISLSICGRGDLIGTCERRDLDLLEQEYPLK